MTPEQLVILKSAITNAVDQTLIDARNAGNNTDIAAWFNVASEAIVWRSSTSVSEVQDAVVWANMTPADVPDGTTAWTNRALACQGKQFNLQNLIVGRDRINSGKANIRAGLQDALTNIPSGVGGASQSAGWVTIRDAMKRAATKGEALYATGTLTSATPGNLVWEGTITRETILDALAS